MPTPTNPPVPSAATSSRPMRAWTVAARGQVLRPLHRRQPRHVPHHRRRPGPAAAPSHPRGQDHRRPRGDDAGPVRRGHLDRGPGTTFFLPRGQVHTFRSIGGPAEILCSSSCPAVDASVAAARHSRSAAINTQARQCQRRPLSIASPKIVRGPRRSGRGKRRSGLDVPRSSASRRSRRSRPFSVISQSRTRPVRRLAPTSSTTTQTSPLAVLAGSQRLP